MRTDPTPLVLHVLHSLENGGTARQLVSLLRGFDRSRMRHAVVTLRGAGALACGLPDDVACQTIAADGRSWSCGWRLGQIARRGGAAILHARNTGCWTDALIAGILSPRTRVVLGFHGVDDATCDGKTWVRKARRVLRFGASLTTVSESRRDRLHRDGRMVSDRVTALPNGVDLQRFVSITPSRRQVARTALDLPQDAFVVGAVASLTRVKRLDLLIEAVGRLTEEIPSLHLVIVGEGPLRTELQALARQLGIADRVRFTGARGDIECLLPALDVYACTSDSEEVSNAMLEAMAAALPVITTDVGDHGRIVRNGIEGFTIRTGDGESLVHAIRELAQSDMQRGRLAAAARTRAEQFGMEYVVRAYEAHYSRLLTAPVPASSTVFAAPARRVGCVL